MVVAAEANNLADKESGERLVASGFEDCPGERDLLRKYCRMDPAASQPPACGYRIPNSKG
jgi:hypothetical protein